MEESNSNMQSTSPVQKQGVDEVLSNDEIDPPMAQAATHQLENLSTHGYQTAGQLIEPESVATEATSKELDGITDQDETTILDLEPEKSAALSSEDFMTNIDLNHDKIETEFKKVMNELSEDPTMSSFRLEYTRIHAALLESHRNERRMMKKCRQLQIQIASSSAENAAAHKRADDAKDTIEHYRSEVEKAWRMVDIANEKDQEVKETMEALQVEINRLRQTAGREEVSTSEKVSALDRLNNTKNEMLEERDNLQEEIVELKTQLEKANIDCEVAQRAQEDLQLKLDTVTMDLQMHTNDLQRETRRKERAERDAKNAQKNIEHKQAELKTYTEQLEQGRDNLTKMETALRDQKVINEKSLKDLDALNTKYLKLQQEYESQLASGNQMVQENQMKAIEMRNREEQLTNLRSEMNKIFKQRDHSQKQLRISEAKRFELEEKQNTLAAMINALEKDLDISRKQIENDKKAYESLRHEKEMLKKEILSSHTTSGKQQNLIKLHVQAKKALELEIHQLQQINNDEKVIIARLEKDRERCISESAELKQKVLDLIEEQKTKDMEVFDFNKRLSEADSKLKQKQGLYEAVSKEKDLYRKNLIETQNEVAEMNKKMQITTHQINCLKEENTSREALLQKEELEMQHIVKEKQNLLLELDNLRSLSAERKEKISILDVENFKLSRNISEAQQESENLKKEVAQAMSERDFLGAQLVRRNNEITQMYEKIRVQQSLLSKGEQQYKQRVEDIELLKTEIKKLMREKVLQGRSIHTLEDMQREMYILHKDLLQERSKCKTLEEELSRPQNIHRWRRLQGSDPEQYELILKIQALQKRLITKMEEIAERDREIEAKDKEYAEIKSKLNRQPDSNANEKLLVCKESMRQKIRQMKSISAEIHMYEHQIEQYRCENEKLTTELHQVRKQLLEQKKQIQQNTERNLKAEQEKLPKINTPQLQSKGCRLLQST